MIEKSARRRDANPRPSWFEGIQHKTLSTASGVAYRGKRAIYLALELDRSWTEMTEVKP